ncbi:hypothetical protein ZIOFF_043336 [Zingiber officinale]|uniref:Uncharacterized protein n=1 Tax=Zingiber officinale TaxID=94328 RepID=A0A8J5FX43_ZINOF|nr:hypothetical protein ZIOFF_043336 [Zingiber officinale]
MVTQSAIDMLDTTFHQNLSTHHHPLIVSASSQVGAFWEDDLQNVTSCGHMAQLVNGCKRQANWCPYLEDLDNHKSILFLPIFVTYCDKIGHWGPSFSGHNFSALKDDRVDDLPLGEINEVYLLDFIGSSGFIGELYPKVESVIILDHHKTAVEALCGNASFGKNVIKVIDMDKSGATIAFDFFKEKHLTSYNCIR